MPEDLRQHAGHDAEAGVQHPEVGSAADLRGRGQQAQQPAVEEPGQPLRRVKEVQRRPARRGVHDDQVPLVGAPQLAELLHGHVLLRASEARRQRLVERVREDLGGAVGISVRLDDLVERSLHVQHHGVQAARRIGPVPGLGVTWLRPHAWHQPRGVVQRRQAHRLRQPPGRVDGQHHHVAASLGGAQADGCRDRRLADSAGAAADDDARPAVGDQPVDVELGRATLGHHAAFCSRSAEASRYRPGQPDVAAQPGQLIARLPGSIEPLLLEVLAQRRLGLRSQLCCRARRPGSRCRPGRPP